MFLRQKFPFQRVFETNFPPLELKVLLNCIVFERPHLQTEQKTKQSLTPAAYLSEFNLHVSFCHVLSSYFMIRNQLVVCADAQFVFVFLPVMVPKIGKIFSGLSHCVWHNRRRQEEVFYPALKQAHLCYFCSFHTSWGDLKYVLISKTSSWVTAPLFPLVSFTETLLFWCLCCRQATAPCICTLKSFTVSSSLFVFSLSTTAKKVPADVPLALMSKSYLTDMRKCQLNRKVKKNKTSWLLLSVKGHLRRGISTKPVTKINLWNTDVRRSD